MKTKDVTKKQYNLPKKIRKWYNYISFGIRKMKMPNKYRNCILESNYDFGPIVNIYFSKDLPFTPDYRQIIYLENEYNPFFNQYIQKNYKQLSKYFAERGYVFSYFPKIAKEINTQSIIQYKNPSIKETEINIDNQLTFSSNMLLAYLVESDPKDICPSLIRFKGACDTEEGSLTGVKTELINGHEAYRFSYTKLLSPNAVSLEYQIHYLLNHVGEDNHIFAYKLWRDDADFHFSEDIKEIMDEVKIRIDLLRQKGVNEMVLNTLFQPDNRLSRICIKHNYRIILPDYNNMEIKMSPLPKAVFLLFLKHPEGIAFKDLSDYRSELLQIYQQLTGRSDTTQIEQSICDITDTTKNSINEKCARIREAFVKQFDESLACNYYVTGKRGEPKKIILSQELVIWEAKK